nr:hypothetical protein CFP56_09357 [Quercus suber]
MSESSLPVPAAEDIWSKSPENARGIDERIDFEMYAQAQESTGKRPASLRDRPEQCHDDHSQQPLGASSRADVGHHGIEKPDTGKLHRARRVHATGAQHKQDQPAGHDIAGCEQSFAELEP